MTQSLNASVGTFDISHVITVFNKEDFLTETLASLKAQQTSLLREYIFIDDASTDRSLAMLRAFSEEVPHVTILQNNTNQGPSCRVNQGIALARGKYVHFMDADDILPLATIETLWQTLEKEQGDFLYGKCEKTEMLGTELRKKTLSVPFDYHVSETPAVTFLSKRFAGMALMAKRELCLKAKGCDERMFVQDESLGLHLALASKRFIYTNIPIILVPKHNPTSLSHNKTQQHHDRFLTYFYAFHETQLVENTVRSLLYKRCLSSMWKYYRKQGNIKQKIVVLFNYLQARYHLFSYNEALLEKTAAEFALIANVRRP